MHLIFVNLPIGIFTWKLSAKIGHYFRFYGSYVPGASVRIVIDYKPKESR